MLFYTGTYTSLGGPGVAVCFLDAGKLGIAECYSLPDAIYLILNAKKDRLYAVSGKSVCGADGGSVAAYAVEGKTLRLLSQINTAGNVPCHLCLDNEERFLYAANYMTGCLTVFPVLDDGGLGERIQHIRHEGSGIHPVRQAGPHVHQVCIVPGSDLLCAVDLGLDAVIAYEQEKDTGKLAFHSRLDVSAGWGPRHMVCMDDGPVFIAHELSNKVSAVRYQGDRWCMLQTLSTLPDGHCGENTAAAIRLSKDRRRLFVSNRGHDSLAVYDIRQDGTLVLSGIHSTGGSLPRDFILLNDDLLLVSHQGGDVRLIEFCRNNGFKTLGVLPIAGAVCVCA